jgi:hypothetical protein
VTYTTSEKCFAHGSTLLRNTLTNNKFAKFA